jgi:hypothetical protein
MDTRPLGRQAGVSSVRGRQRNEKHDGLEPRPRQRQTQAPVMLLRRMLDLSSSSRSTGPSEEHYRDRDESRITTRHGGERRLVHVFSRRLTWRISKALARLLSKNRAHGRCLLAWSDIKSRGPNRAAYSPTMFELFALLLIPAPVNRDADAVPHRHEVDQVHRLFVGGRSEKLLAGAKHHRKDHQVQLVHEIVLQ